MEWRKVNSGDGSDSSAEKSIVAHHRRVPAGDHGGHEDKSEFSSLVDETPTVKSKPTVEPN